MLNAMRSLIPALWWLRLSLTGGGGGDSSGQQQQADEAAKQALRDKIDRLYGVGIATPATPGTPAVPQGYISTRVADPTDPVMGYRYEQVPYGVKIPAIPGTPAIPASSDPAAASAQAQIASEDKALGDSTGSYYTDQLNRNYTEAARNLKFRLARQGLIGGSAQSDLGGQLTLDKNLGATRVSDAVKQAVTGLDTSREQQRLNAINLVNSGAGSSAVSAASTGLQNALNNANSAQKVNLFGDLFTAGANNVANGNNANNAAALAARYYNQLGAFYPNSGGSTKIYSTG